MEVLTVINTIERGSYVCKILGYNNKPSMVHINNPKTDNNSVMVPIELLQELLSFADKNLN